jgi:nucleotide-binding universal stress UspA family protein
MSFLGEEIMYNKILAPLDGSKLSECSLEHVKEIASGCHVVEVILLTVLEQTNKLEYYYPKKPIDVRGKEEQQAKEMAEKYLAEAAENLKTQGISVKTVLIQAGIYQSVAEVILNYADSNNIDLIIMSTHGRSGITRWASGSVADRVVQHSKTPVLTIAPKGCRVLTGLH